jgi:hypothetical protein
MIPNLSGTCYALRSLVHISNINTLQTIYYAYFYSVIKCGIILGGNSSTVGRFSLYKRKSSELWVVHDQELHVEVYLTFQSLAVSLRTSRFNIQQFYMVFALR